MKHSLKMVICSQTGCVRERERAGEREKERERKREETGRMEERWGENNSACCEGEKLM